MLPVLLLFAQSLQTIVFVTKTFGLLPLAYWYSGRTTVAITSNIASVLNISILKLRFEILCRWIYSSTLINSN